MRAKLIAFIEAECKIGIPNINCEKHGLYFTFFMKMRKKAQVRA